MPARVADEEDDAGLSLWGVPLERIQAFVDTATEDRLHRLRAAMERRWGIEVLRPGVGHDYMAQAQADLKMKRLVPILVYLDVRSRLAGIEAERRHLRNPVYVSQVPVVLKRAVSWRELLDVLQTGHVVGRQNLWHVADPRPMVMWGCVLSSDARLLTQANELQRQAVVVLCEELGVRVDSNAVSRTEVDRWTRHERAARAQAEWTSAILVTHPIAGSTVWPSANRDNMFSGQDEHGLPPGRVRLADIDQVRLYRQDCLVWQGRVHDVEDVLAGLDAPHGIRHVPASAPSPSLRAC